MGSRDGRFELEAHALKYAQVGLAIGVAYGTLARLPDLDAASPCEMYPSFQRWQKL